MRTVLATLCSAAVLFATLFAINLACGFANTNHAAGNPQGFILWSIIVIALLFAGIANTVFVFTEIYFFE